MSKIVIRRLVVKEEKAIVGFRMCILGDNEKVTKAYDFAKCNYPLLEYAVDKLKDKVAIRKDGNVYSGKIQNGVFSTKLEDTVQVVELKSEKEVDTVVEELSSSCVELVKLSDGEYKVLTKLISILKMNVSLRGSDEYFEAFDGEENKIISMKDLIANILECVPTDVFSTKLSSKEVKDFNNLVGRFGVLFQNMVI